MKVNQGYAIHNVTKRSKVLRRGLHLYLYIIMNAGNPNQENIAELRT